MNWIFKKYASNFLSPTELTRFNSSKFKVDFLNTTSNIVLFMTFYKFFSLSRENPSLRRTVLFRLLLLQAGVVSSELYFATLHKRFKTELKQKYFHNLTDQQLDQVSQNGQYPPSAPPLSLASMQLPLPAT